MRGSTISNVHANANTITQHNNFFESSSSIATKSAATFNTKPAMTLPSKPPQKQEFGKLHPSWAAKQSKEFTGMGIKISVDPVGKLQNKKIVFD